MKLVQILLWGICSLIFAYYTFQSLKDYLSYNTVSKQNKERQEDQLMPQICFSSPYLAEERLQKLGLTLEEYRKLGIWTSSHTNYSKASEDEIKRMVFPDLTDMVENVRVKSRISKYSDAYKSTYYKPADILNGTDIGIVELDYYHFFSIYCISFPSSTFPFGIEKVYFSLNQKCKVFVVAPGNFYAFDRKRNEMTILADQSYEYQVAKNIVQLLLFEVFVVLLLNRKITVLLNLIFNLARSTTVC